MPEITIPRRKPTSLDASDYIGQVFGRLTVLGNANDLKGNKRKWKCRCSCGNITERGAYAIKIAHVRSCGCLEREARFRHGYSDSPEYSCWNSMIQRTTNPNSVKYSYYGGSGISVCPEWCDSFIAFFIYIGPRPTPKHEIDRYPNKKGNYEPGNVRWATRKQQTRNTSRNRMITFNGVTQCIADWAALLGIKWGTLKLRLNKWPLERALTTPPLKRSGSTFVPR